MRILTATIKIIMPDGGDDEGAKTILADMVEEANRWEYDAETPFVVMHSVPQFEEKEDPCSTGLQYTLPTLEDPSEPHYDKKQVKIWKEKVQES